MKIALSAPRLLAHPRSLALALLLAACFLPRLATAEVLWIEGEKPVKSSMNRHPWWYDKVKRDQFSGGDFISNFDEKKTGEAEYVVRAKAAGPYDFWVRANPVQAQMSYQLNAGPWTEIDLAANQIGNVNVADDGKPDLRFIAWFKVGKVSLKQGANTLRFKMHSKNSNHGYLDCFVLANEPFEPKGILKPADQAKLAQRIADENKGWFAFAPQAENFEAASGFDLRSLNEKFAGEGGFIAVKDGHFVHSATGTPVRFWAVNGPPQELRDRELLRKNARLLAKYGVNLVRIHGGLYDESGNLKPEIIKQKIAIVESMKEEGIYSHISIYFPLWMQPKPGTPWLEGYDGKTNPFATLMFNKDFQRQYREWWKAVLLTPSEKTGKRLIDEPALFGAEIQNEDSYFFWTFSPDRIPDVQMRILEKQFGDWLKKKYGSLDAALAQWKGQKVSRDNPAEGRISFRPMWNMFNEKTARDQDAAAFLTESQRRFYEETYQFLRDLGFKGLITCSNWTTASPEVLGPLEKYTYMAGDFIDRHGYFSCNHKGEAAEWSIRNGHTYSDRSALRFEAETPGKPKQFAHPVMDPHYGGKPSVITETTFNRPNRYRSEAPLYFAAYGALQDTDCLVHFALDSATWAVKPGYFMQPWTLMTPAMAGQFPATALLYRKGLVSPGEVLVELNLGVKNLLALQGTPLPQDAAFDELRLKDVPKGLELKPGSVIDPLVHYAGRTTVAFSEKGGPAKLRDLKPFVNRAKESVTSTNKQLKLDYGKGILYVNAPAIQGMSGALDKAGKTRLSDLRIESPMPLGHILAVSLDDQPLATSKRILLQVMSEEKATNFRTEPVKESLQRITNIGQDPWLVKEIRGSVAFTRPDATELKVTVLDHSGYPRQTLGDAGSIELRPDALYYLIEAK